MLKPYEYQKEGIRAGEQFLADGGGFLLADDMGLGKTLQALWILKRAKPGKMLPALIICPASVKRQWAQVIREQAGWSVLILEGKKERNIALLQDVCIINPTILQAWRWWLKRQAWQCVVIDECQCFGNAGTRQTQAAMDLVDSRIPYRIAMSGTPLTNRTRELWPVLYMLRPDVWPSFLLYAQAHCDPKKIRGRWTYDGATNVPQLFEQLKGSVMVRRRKIDKLPGLPDKVRTVTPLEIRDPKQYAKASKEFLSWLAETGGQEKVEKAKKALAVVKLGSLLRLAARLKAKAVVEWINTWLTENPGEKLLVFAIHKQMVSLLARRIDTKCVTISGATSADNRQAAKVQFIENPEVRVLVGNIRAAGTGIDGLQQVCSTVVKAELWWQPAVHVQAEDRVFRIGQEKTAWIHYLVATGTIEEALCAVLQEKNRILHGVLDGEVPDDMDILDQLLTKIQGED